MAHQPAHPTDNAAHPTAHLAVPTAHPAHPDDHTKKYMKAMKEFEEPNFGSFLKGIISNSDLNALLRGENTD